MKKNEYTSYYAVYKDGSYVPIEDLSGISKIPACQYVMKTNTYSDEHDNFNNRYRECYFIDESGENKPLRIGDWELVNLSREWIHKNQTMVMTYKLFNHITETVVDFKRNTKNLDFF